MSEVTNLILATLAAVPAGMTTSEIAEATGMASYNTSGKLSKLAAYGIIAAVKLDGRRMRWRLKPKAAAIP